MDTLAKILESRLIIKLRPLPGRPILPWLAALCSGGVFAAELPMDNPHSADALQCGRKLFPDLVLGAGNVLTGSDAQKAIAAGARYISSPGYSSSLSKLCKDHDVLYLPRCMTPTELLAVKEDGLPAVFLFAPHLWGSLGMMDALIDAFPSLSFLASDLSHSSVSTVHTHPRIGASSVSGLESLSPEALVGQCHHILASIVSSDS